MFDKEICRFPLQFFQYISNFVQYFDNFELDTEIYDLLQLTSLKSLNNYGSVSFGFLFNFLRIFYIYFLRLKKMSMSKINFILIQTIYINNNNLVQSYCDFILLCFKRCINSMIECYSTNLCDWLLQS